MTSETFVILSGALTFGVPFSLAIGELMSLKQSPRNGGEPPRSYELPPAPKPLPDCLMPKPTRIVRKYSSARVLEDA